jgi:hypothetical protein
MDNGERGGKSFTLRESSTIVDQRESSVILVIRTVSDGTNHMDHLAPKLGLSKWI